MGAMWDEPGWLHNRMGQISKRVRATLMDKSEFELKVVDSGMWQLGGGGQKLARVICFHVKRPIGL